MSSTADITLLATGGTIDEVYGISDQVADRRSSS